MFPMAAHMFPLRANLLPSVGNPMSSAVTEYEAARNPGICAAVPFPVARSPNIAVARRRSPLVARGRGRRIGSADGEHHGRPPNSAGSQAQRNQQCVAKSLHFQRSLTFAHLTTPIGVSKTSIMLPVKQKLHRSVQS